MGLQQELGARIRSARLEAGRTQRDLAASVGISSSYLALMEKGRRPVSDVMLDALADALGTGRDALTGEVDPELAARLSLVGGAARDAAALLRDAPAWADVVLRLHDRLLEAETRIEASRDRASADPRLADAMHEVRTAAAGIRSTASILVGTPDLERSWIDRFLASLDADARRLAAGAETLAARLDHGEMGERAGDLLTLAHLAVVVADASGTPVLRRPAPGFPIPSRTCPLWPLHAATARPLHPIDAVMEMPDGGAWRAEAAVEVVAHTPLGPVLRTTMLATRIPEGGADAIPVGPDCPICPRAACPARRSPSHVA